MNLMFTLLLQLSPRVLHFYSLEFGCENPKIKLYVQYHCLQPLTQCAQHVANAEA